MRTTEALALYLSRSIMMSYEKGANCEAFVIHTWNKANGELIYPIESTVLFSKVMFNEVESHTLPYKAHI